MLINRKISIPEEPSPVAINVDSAYSAMVDSVWVINTELLKDEYSKKKDLIEKNVAHLKLMLENPEINQSGQNLNTIQSAVEAGESYLNSLQS